MYFSFLKSDARHHIAKLTRQSSKHFAEILTFNLANAFLHCPPSRSYRTVQRLLVASNPIDLSKSDCCERTAAIVNRTTGLVPAFRPVYSQWKMGMGLTALSGVNQRQFKCGCPAVLRNSHLRIPASHFCLASRSALDAAISLAHVLQRHIRAARILCNFCLKFWRGVLSFLHLGSLLLSRDPPSSPTWIPELPLCLSPAPMFLMIVLIYVCL